MEHAEVAIVGAGLAGASVAWWLARHARVLVLEQGAAPGAEASSQNAGMLRRLATDPAERALAMRSARWLGDPPGEEWGGPLLFRSGGLIGVVAPGSHDEALAAAAADLQHRGVAVEEVRGDAAARLTPSLAGARVHRAWYLPKDGVVDVHRVVQGFLGGARRHGARVRSGVCVRALVVEAGRIAGLDTDCGPIRADAVVLAAGAWSARLAATAGLVRRLVPLRRHLLYGGPHPLSRPGLPYAWLEDAAIYARPASGGWLSSPCDERLDDPPEGPGSTGPVEEVQRAVTADKLARHLPALAGLRLSSGWTGLRTFAPDRRPFLGPDPEIASLWWASALGGFGVTCSFAVGELVAELLRGQDVDWIDPASVAPGRRFEQDLLPA